MFLTLDEWVTWGVCSLILYLCLNFRLMIAMRSMRRLERRRRLKARRTEAASAPKGTEQPTSDGAAPPVDDLCGTHPARC